jgi:hypothetical protein
MYIMDKYDILGYIILFALLGLCFYIYTQGDTLELKCVLSTVDGNKYCVRDRKEVKRAADLLAKITNECKKLVEYMIEKHPDNDCTKRLKSGFNPQKIMETLPTSEYTAYSENKGEKLAFCLNKRKSDNNDLIDEHTLMFVALHELSHVATESIGHKTDFWQNFKFILECAKEMGIHDPEDYKKKPAEYCGMKIRDNPFYDA